MGLRPTQGNENGFCLAIALNESAALPFVIPSEAEGSAVCRPVLEMFFDRVLMQVEVKVCSAYGARRECWGIDAPAQAGWADGLAVGPTGLKPRPLPRKTFPGRGL